MDLMITNKNRLIKLYTDVVMSLFSCFIIIILDNTQTSLKYLGFILVFISLYLVIKVRFNTYLLILFGLIAYINIAVSMGDLLQIGTVLSDKTLSWQMATRMSEYNVIGAKCMLILMSILNLCLNSEYLRKMDNNEITVVTKKNNNLIFFIGYLVLLIFWFFGYKNAVGNSYESNTRTIYEYCIIIFIVVWFYSGDSKFNKYLLNLYAFLYIIQALYRGDRSSVFPMILVLFLIQNYKIKLRTLIMLAISGILASNIVSIYRESFSLEQLKSQYLARYGMSLFLSDTVSQSYYTAITILNVHDLIPSTIGYFLNFLGGIIVGGNFKNADVGAIAYNYMLNKGGGFYFSWFYFWFGYIGVIIASLFLGYLIRFTFKSKNNYIKLFKVGLIAMAFRWYLYTPFVLYRTVLFIFVILIFICFLVERFSLKN